MALLLDNALETRVLSHYYLVAETIAKHFAGEPIVFANFPAGFDKPPHWHRTQVPLSSNKLLWLCHRMFAVEFHGWAPLPNQLDRLRFARILLESSPDASRRDLAAITLRDMLAEYRLQAAPIFDGNGGIALWIPFADAPGAQEVRTWLHAFCNNAVARRPDLFTTEPNTHDVKRVHLHVSSNAAWHFSILPYSLRGADGFPVATPFRWEELDSLNGALRVDAFAERWKKHGDVFGDVLAAIPPQTFASLSASPQLQLMIAQPRGTAITAAFDILEDGKARTAQQILDEALARGLVQPNMTKKYVYTALIEYIARTIGQMSLRRRSPRSMRTPMHLSIASKPRPPVPIRLRSKSPCATHSRTWVSPRRTSAVTARPMVMPMRS
jgi:DNA primase